MFDINCVFQLRTDHLAGSLRVVEMETGRHFGGGRSVRLGPVKVDPEVEGEPLGGDCAGPGAGVRPEVGTTVPI